MGLKGPKIIHRDTTNNVKGISLCYQRYILINKNKKIQNSYFLVELELFVQVYLHGLYQVFALLDVITHDSVV